MSEQVYVVTSGRYKDYRIERIFADKAAAEAYVEREMQRQGLTQDRWIDGQTHSYLHYLNSVGRSVEYDMRVETHRLYAKGDTQP